MRVKHKLHSTKELINRYDLKNKSEVNNTCKLLLIKNRSKIGVITETPGSYFFLDKKNNGNKL